MFGSRNKQIIPSVLSILPYDALQEILNGRLPILNIESLFLKHNEVCHYVDKAILLKNRPKKQYKNRSVRYGLPGLFKGDRVLIGNSNIDVIESVQEVQEKGIVYITNKRIIFTGESVNFDISLDSLLSIMPYKNYIEIIVDQKKICMFSPDGYIINAAISLIMRGKT